ncbi:hypothetical protein Ancab_031963 [Ancistrocladus abbreviatus]
MLPIPSIHIRDSYGFAIRPQHLQRYKEYDHIYKEEEEERSGKWNTFLEQFAKPMQLSSSAKLKAPNIEAMKQKREPASTNNQEVDKSGGRSIFDGMTEGRAEKEVPVANERKAREVQTSWAPIRPSLAPIEKMMSVRVEQQIDIKLGEPLSPIDEGRSSRRFYEDNIEGQLSNNELTKDSSRQNELSDDSCKIEKNSNKFHGKNEKSNDFYEEAMAQLDSPQKKAKTRNSYQEKEKSSNGKGGKEEDGVVDDNAPFEHSPWKEELESLVHGGVPKSLRGEVWQAFVGVRTRRVERYYQDLLSSEINISDDKRPSDENTKSSLADDHLVPEKCKKQIEKDLPRTFPGHPALNDEGRNSLRRILTAYARHNPSVGYCQAMNFFAGLLLLMMPEENAFWTLVGIIDDYFDGYYTHEMIESQVDQLVFEELMRERFPKLVNHLDYLGVQVAWISGPWFLSIFVNMLPWESVLRVWDVLLFEGNRVMLFRTALAIMELYGPAIVTTKDAGDAVTLLQSLAGSTFDSSQLVFTACMGFLGVNEGRLQELRNKHRPAVLGIIEERLRGSQVFKDSKSLATKLYSFKHESKLLVKEGNAKEGLGVKAADKDSSHPKSSPDNFHELYCDIDIASEVDSLPDLQDQVVWLKVQLCRMLEEKRSATIRAEELETAFIEIVKEDNRRQLSARIEELEQEVMQLRQALAEKQEQEQAMVQVLMRVEQEQKLTEDARIAAEQDAAAQRAAVLVLQKKYDKVMSSLAEAEKRVVMAESMLEATLQYESGQAKAMSSPRFSRQDSLKGLLARKGGLLSFGLGWRDKNKGKQTSVEGLDESGSIGKPIPGDQHQTNVEGPGED